MSLSPTNVVPGIIGELPNDPRVQEAVERLQGKNVESLASQAVLSKTPSLEKYGIKMRPQNLMQGALISRIMALGDVDEYYQPWIWLWSLCAPLNSIYKSIDTAKKEGVPSLMADVHSWFSESGLPNEITQEVMEAVAQTFALASQLAPKSSDTDATVKKNQTPGGSSLLTS